MSNLIIPGARTRAGSEGVRLDALDRTILGASGLVGAFWPRCDRYTRPIAGYSTSSRRVSSRDAVDPRVVWRHRGGGGGAEGYGVVDDTTLPGVRTIATSAGNNGYIWAYPSSIADDAIDEGTPLVPFGFRPAATGGVSVMGVARWDTDAFDRIIGLSDGTRWIVAGPRGLSVNKFYAVAGNSSSSSSSTYTLGNAQAAVGSFHLWWMSLDYSDGRLRLGVDTVAVGSPRAATRVYSVADDCPDRISEVTLGWVAGIGGADPLWLGPTLIFDRPIGTDTATLVSAGTAVAARCNITLG